jgi:hypothetical protein
MYIIAPFLFTSRQIALSYLLPGPACEIAAPPRARTRAGRQVRTRPEWFERTIPDISDNSFPRALTGSGVLEGYCRFGEGWKMAKIPTNAATVHDARVSGRRVRCSVVLLLDLSIGHISLEQVLAGCCS